MKKQLTAVLSAMMMTLITYAQNVGIGTTNPLEKLSVGTTSQFRVDANGNITRINNLPYSFPSLQGGVNQFLRNDGSGNLTWSNPVSGPKPVIRTFSVVNNNSVSWAIDNAADYNASPFNLNPTLVLYRGFTYEFSVNSSGHPFRIATTNGGPAYTVGINVNDQTSGTITFTVPMDAPNNLHYYCTVHPAMNGPIIVR